MLLKIDTLQHVCADLCFLCDEYAKASSMWFPVEIVLRLHCTVASIWRWCCAYCQHIICPNHSQTFVLLTNLQCAISDWFRIIEINEQLILRVNIWKHETVSQKWFTVVTDQHRCIITHSSLIDHSVWLSHRRRLASISWFAVNSDGRTQQW